ncbi:flagellar type III secretion system pore protein FliP [Variovorax sp. RKNM96]|uniref:flagellar type III secretion system pore protein FliP n=1 Tax=Variovorax sp. RKNM96 TaxID=2681552 RepID=UPI001F124D99|nr:flagellar type III secretion system pore protein FliP [Variovorax sp. RKNM96]
MRRVVAGSDMRTKQSWVAVLALALWVAVLLGWPVSDARAQAQEEVVSETVPAPSEPPPVISPAPAVTADVPAPAPKSAAPAPNPARPKAQPAANPVAAAATPATETAQALRVVLGLTVLAILPALLVCLTSFLRIIVVLSMLRHAIGMNETPPNTVLIGLALFLTLFTMSPVLQKVNQDAFEPFMAGKLSTEQGYTQGIAPLREFMVRQTREADLALMVELSKAPTPKSMDDISNVQLIPSFMLSELRSAFQIGFVIFLPFLLIDLIVSSILMALGMMMMPPTTIALPLKILMFVLVDGWSLVLKALVGSFH